MMKTRGFGEREESAVAGSGGLPASGMPGYVAAGTPSFASSDSTHGIGGNGGIGATGGIGGNGRIGGNGGNGPSPGGVASASLPVPAMHLLVVDDDEAVRNACVAVAQAAGFVVNTADSVPAAQTVLKCQAVDLLLLDLKLPGGGGLALLEEVKLAHPETAVVVMTAFATVSSAVEAMRIGATDYLTKPFALDDLTAKLARASQQRHYDLESRMLRERLRTQRGNALGNALGTARGSTRGSTQGAPREDARRDAQGDAQGDARTDGRGGDLGGQIVGNSPEMERLYRILSKVAFTTHPVLILGESGTGKEMVARSIHFNGPNAHKPFVPVDCGSLVPTLIESELFGYVKGAFTGASRSKEGLLASAEGGTVFLDEIGELPLDLQARLLRALQEKEVRPVGATHAVPISARVLAATNRDLSVMVEQGRFRKDLYFRLNVVNLKIPPLRARREDIPMLAYHFLERMQRETGRQHTFSDDALRLMSEYDWPGNVRELYNAIERACALSSGPVLHMADLPTQLDEFRRHQQQLLLDQRLMSGQQLGQNTGRNVAQDMTRDMTRDMNRDMTRDMAPTDTSLTHLETGDAIVSIAELEKQAILNTIRQLNGDKLMAAKLLRIGKTTLYRKLKEYGITEPA